MSFFSPQLHKSQILKKAIDYIRYLQSQNTRLRTELNTFRMRDGSQKITDLLGPYTPPPSDSSSPARSPLSDSSLPPSPSTTKLEVKEEVLFKVSGYGKGRFIWVLVRLLGSGCPLEVLE